MKSLGNAILENGSFTDGETGLIEEVDSETSFHNISASEEDWRKFIKKLSKKGFEDLQKVRDTISQVNQE